MDKSISFRYIFYTIKFVLDCQVTYIFNIEKYKGNVSHEN